MARKVHDTRITLDKRPERYTTPDVVRFHMRGRVLKSLGKMTAYAIPAKNLLAGYIYGHELHLTPLGSDKPVFSARPTEDGRMEVIWWKWGATRRQVRQTLAAIKQSLPENWNIMDPRRIYFKHLAEAAIEAAEAKGKADQKSPATARAGAPRLRLEKGGRY